MRLQNGFEPNCEIWSLLPCYLKKGKYKVRKEFKRKKNQLHEELFLPFIMSRVVDIVYEKKEKIKNRIFITENHKKDSLILISVLVYFYRNP